MYEYAPLGIDEISYVNWEKDIMNKHCDNTFVSIIYWRLDEFSCKLVLRNKKWFSRALKKIKTTWDIIENERELGYEHRAPKKRIRKNSVSDDEKKCFINISHKLKTEINNDEIN